MTAEDRLDRVRKALQFARDDLHKKNSTAVYMSPTECATNEVRYLCDVLLNALNDPPDPPSPVQG